MSFPSKFFVIDFVGTARPAFFNWLVSLETEKPMDRMDADNPWKYLEEREYRLMCDLFRSMEEGYSRGRRIVLEATDRHVELHVEAIIPNASLAYQHWIEDIGDRLISQHNEQAMKPTAWLVDGTFTSVDVLLNRTNQFASFQYPLPRDWVLPWMFPVFVRDNWERARSILAPDDNGSVHYDHAFMFFKDIHRHSCISAAEAFLTPAVAEKYDFKAMNCFGEPFVVTAGASLSLHFTNRSTEVAHAMVDPTQVKSWTEGTALARVRRGL